MTREDAVLDAPDIGQGTWQMEQGDRKGAIAALQRGLELGMTHIDTAEMYGSGAVEELVGEALRGRREQAFVASKVLPSNASRAGTIAACERSLRRLRIERLDLYLLHWPGQHPLEETIAAFEQLIDSGKIARWGVSNFDEVELANALRIAGSGRIACNQVLYHLGERHIERRVIPWCVGNRVPVVAYSPFGSGELPRHEALSAIAAAHGATERQVALRFLARAPGVYAIPKAATVEHVEDNAGALTLHLAEDDLARLDQAFPLGPDQGLPVI